MFLIVKTEENSARRPLGTLFILSRFDQSRFDRFCKISSGAPIKIILSRFDLSRFDHPPSVFKLARGEPWEIARFFDLSVYIAALL